MNNTSNHPNKPNIPLNEIDLEDFSSSSYGGNLEEYPFYEDYLFMNHPEWKRRVTISITSFVGCDSAAMHYYIMCEFEKIPFVIQENEDGECKLIRKIPWDYPKKYSRFNFYGVDLFRYEYFKPQNEKIIDNKDFVYEMAGFDDDLAQVLRHYVKNNPKPFERTYEEKKAKGIFQPQRANDFVRYLLDEILITEKCDINLRPDAIWSEVQKGEIENSCFEPDPE